MTPHQPSDLQTYAMAAAGLGVLETIMGLIYARSAGPQRNIAGLFLWAGPAFLIAGAILYFAWDYMQSLTVAGCVAIAGCVWGAFQMVRAAQESSGDQPQ
jgi:hypothetical protein